MQFGTRVRELREHCGLPQKELAERLEVSPSYVNKVERERLHFGDYPSAKYVHSLAEELDAHEDELLLLADKVPDALRQRILERPDVFNAVSDLDDKAMDRLLKQISGKSRRTKT